MKNIILFILFATYLNTLSAQTLSDALRLSHTNYYGTARTIGVGGAFGALGGDQGGIYYNAATLGTYSKPELIVNPSLNSTNSVSSLKPATPYNSDKTRFGINFGLVFVNKRPAYSDWKTSNVSIGFYKINDLNRKFRFKGTSVGSIVNRFLERAHSKSLNELDNFEAGLAYDAGAIYDFNKDKVYESDVLEGQTFNKYQEVVENGYINEFSIAWAGSYKKKLNVGVRLGFPYIKFNQNKRYSERPNFPSSQFQYLGYKESLKTEGTGVNLQIGAIYAPAKFFRLGASIQTPTYYGLKDSYNTELQYIYEDDDNNRRDTTVTSPNGYFNYSFTTPWIINVDGGFLLNTKHVKGFISGGISYRSYTTSFFSLSNRGNSVEDRNWEVDQNYQIDNQLKNTLNAHVGLELALSIVRLRAGMQLIESPYFVDDSFSRAVSFGAGLRFNKFYVDIGTRIHNVEEGYAPYVLLDKEHQPLVTTSDTRITMLTTFGFMF